MNSRLAVLAIGAALTGAAAAAAPASPLQGIAPLQERPYQTVQYYGRRYWDDEWYCFYWDGWRGPGWYLCDYEWRYGYGWGGPSGWHGWRNGVRPRGFVPRGNRGRVDRGNGRPNRIYRGPATKGWSGGSNAPRSFVPRGGSPRGFSGGNAGKGGGGGGGGKGGGANRPQH